jgi:protein involved in polysaccharide export with SLBB domain
VGPGDELAFRSSDLVDPKILRIGPAGDLLLPDVGALAVAGMTLAALEADVRERMRPFVRGRGFILTLHRPRRFLATVVGDVARPGAVLVQAPVRASDAIAAAGGVLPGGARRGILLLRDRDSLWVDLDLFTRRGDVAANPLVFETDVVVVPPGARQIAIDGAVAHPEWYAFAPGDRVSTLVAVAGGALPSAALDAAALSRASDKGPAEPLPLDLAAALAAPGGADDPELRPGDRIFLPERAHWRESAHVIVVGEVERPGPYPIADGVDRISSLLERAGGFTEWADRVAARIERGSDAAVRDSAFLRLAREQDGVLPAGERGYLLAVTRERRALSVAIGGFLDGGDARGDVPLLNGDRIVVPRRALTVMVQGAVKLPGHVPYREAWSHRDYIRAAGGYAAGAQKDRIRVTLAATGRPVGASDTGTLHPGDIVWVPIREPGNAWGTIRDVLTTAAQVATIYLVVREATR